MTGLNVYQRMAKACEIISSQPWVKDLENPQYKSVPIDAMRNGVRAACVQAGLVHVGPSEIDYTANNDGRMTRVMGTCKFYYINTDNPEERIEFESMGEAMDPGDKCVGKFMTNLIKNHYKAAFDIGEHNEDDVDSYSNEEIEAKVKTTTDKFFGTPAGTPTKQEPKKKWDPKSLAQPDNAEKGKLIEDLTDIIMGGGSAMRTVNSMLNNRAMEDVPIAELKAMYEAVHPFEPKGAKE